MQIERNRLSKQDAELFASMEGNYISENEANFFKNMQYKQEYEISGLNDLIISEYENEDEIYLVRQYYEEYLVGHGIDSDGTQEEHTMTLAEALGMNLKEVGFIDKDITLLDWLRACDYDCVKYNRNYDLTR